MTESITSSPKDLEENSNNADTEIDEQIKELKHDFHEVLADKPEILKYIERLHTVIRRQQKKLNKLYRKLKDHRLLGNHGGVDKWTQTDESEVSADIKAEVQGDQKVSEPPTKSDVPWESANEGGGDIIDEVKEAAESAMQQTSFVYEPTSGMYYDYSTGYYYNAELRMYYDGNTGQYLEYDEETKQYKYHIVEGMETATISDNNTNSSTSQEKKSKKRKEKQKVNEMLEEEPDLEGVV